MFIIWRSGLQLVFSKRKYKFAFAALIILLVPLYAALTDIIILAPQLAFNPSIKPLEAFLIFSVAILASLGFTIAAYQIFELHSISKKSVGGSILGAGAGGSILATFASACVVCQPIWLVWLGFGSASIFLVDFSIYIVLASLAILLYSVHTGLRSVVDRCKVKKTGKN